MKSEKPKKRKRTERLRQIEFLIPLEGEEFSIELMKEMTGKIWGYVPENDPKDPLHNKKEGDKEK